MGCGKAPSSGGGETVRSPSQALGPARAAFRQREGDEGAGSFEWALRAHVVPTLTPLLWALPASPRPPRDVGTFPPTQRALKGPWEAAPRRLDPDLCAQRVPGPAGAGVLARAY